MKNVYFLKTLLILLVSVPALSTKAQIFKLIDIAKGTASSSPNGLASNDTDKVFSAATVQFGRELWVTDGTISGTKLVKDIYPGAMSASPFLFTKFRAKTYFFATDASGLHLWKTNGTPALTQEILTPNFTINPDNGEILSKMIASNDLLYFAVSAGEDAHITPRLYRSDGTSAGTYLLTTDAGILSTLGNTLFLVKTLGDGFTQELWVSNGLVADTKRLKNLYPGSTGLNLLFPLSFVNFKGKLYFSASDNQSGQYDLWTSDGTGAGTTILKSRNAIPDGQANGKLFFDGSISGSNGVGLFTSDGTSAGTKLIKDFGPASSTSLGSANGDNDVVGNKILYFIVNDGATFNLWKSDGTTNGTNVIKDLKSAIHGGFIDNFVNANDKLFFIINDTLWTSNGTSTGTHKVSDGTATLNGVSRLSNLTYLDGYLYFTGTSTAAGTELYSTKLSTTVAAVEMVNNTIISNTDEFAAKLLTNPVAGQVKLSITVKAQQTAQVLITDVSGKTIKNDKQVLVPGTNMFSYDAATWPKGMYMIKIATANGFSGVLKAIK